MAKWQNDAMLDTALTYLKANVSQMTICTSQPTTYAQATSTYNLGSVALSSTDLAIGDGDGSGRKVTVAAQSSITVDTSGTAQHVALISSSDSTLRYVTTCSSQALVTGNTVDTNAWDIEIADAT